LFIVPTIFIFKGERRRRKPLGLMRYISLLDLLAPIDLGDGLSSLLMTLERRQLKPNRKKAFEWTLMMT
jgi:hypothetical protein